jgi:integrase
LAIQVKYVDGLLPRLAQKAGIDKRVHPHGLRHTHASELRSEGLDIGVISRQLGHKSIATTAQYLDHIAPQAVIEAVRARRWGRNGNGRASEVERLKSEVVGLLERLEALKREVAD